MDYQKLVNKEETLSCGETYHIYNRAVGDELLFKSEKDYEYFIKKLKRFIIPIANIFAYCLIPNHFHLLLKIKESDYISGLHNIEEKEYSKFITKVFGNFFNSYSKSYNKVHKRKGRLFIQPYKRIVVEDEYYFRILVNYIHRNPIHHGLVLNFSDWKYSSYSIILSNKTTFIDNEEVLSFFNSKEEFIEFHNENKVRDTGNDYLE